jgi:hypothetical protein
MSRRARAAAFAALLLGLAPSAAPATTIVPVTTEELTRRSDEVVVATVRASTSRWEHGLIVTDHELVVEASLRGPSVAGGTVFLRTPGGVVGRIAQVIPDAPSLEVGRSYLFFLSGGVGTVRFLAHLTAAVVPVEATAQGALVARPSSSLLVDRSQSAPTAVAPPPMPLPAMLDRVRAVPR